MTAWRAALACELPCTLGEGLLWDARAQRWCWTDIEAACLYTWAGGSAAPRRDAVPDRLACFAPAASGRWLLGLSQGLAWGDWCGDALRVTPLCPVEPDQPTTRLNDGRTDRSGRFVFGTLDEAEPRRARGGFYQFSLSHGLRRLALPAVRISNSICFSPDGGTLYFTDTPSGLIQQCRYDSQRAWVDAPRPFARVAAPACPDGSVVDADGCLWNAQWGGGLVQRFSPAGQRLQAVHADAPQLTCPAFGGPELRHLMVASARQGLDAAALARAPRSGSLFRATPAGCRGLAEPPFDDLEP